MKAIGPYVVIREVSPAGRSGEATATTLPIARRTLWVTDRLTGMPALLHELPAPISAPELPRAASLLPFNDLVIEGATAFLVTELPLHAVPANDPLLAAKAALAALEALHSRGLAHGSLDAGQLWSVDGKVMLAGGGLHQLDPHFSVARDLKDLASTLDELGGLPPILSLLRNPSDSLTAHEARQLLEAGAQVHSASADIVAGTVIPEPEPIWEEAAHQDGQRTRQPSVPALQPMSLLDNSAPLPQQGPYLWQASWTPLDSEMPPARIGSHSASSVTTSSTTANGFAVSPPVNLGGMGETFQLDISEWTFPDFLDSPATTTPDAAPPPVVMTAAPVTLEWAKPNRPAQNELRGDESPAPSAAPADLPAEPVAPESVDTEVTAQAINLPADQKSDSVQQLPAAPVKRKAKAAAGRALDRLRADSVRTQNMAEARRDHLPSQWQAVAEGTLPPLTEQAAAETPQERRRRELAAMQEQAQFDAQNSAERKAKLLAEPSGEAQPPVDAPAVSKRQLKPIKVTWTADQTWQVVHEGEDPRSAGRPLPKAFAGAPAWLLPLLIGLGVVLLLGLAISGLRGRNAPPVTAACCNVEFKLLGQGAEGKTAQLTLESAPPDAGLGVGQVLGTAPGNIHVPVEGTYRVRVATEGFTPASVNFVVPTSQPVQINLGQ